MWDEFIPWLRSHTKLKILLKGLMTAEDAVLALQYGVDGIVVSNHGGRQLDGVPSTREALPEVSNAVEGRVPVIFDGGISQGSDAFKALALGADLCLIGPSALWDLAYNGQKGVEEVLHLLERAVANHGSCRGKVRRRHLKGHAWIYEEEQVLSSKAVTAPHPVLDRLTVKFWIIVSTTWKWCLGTWKYYALDEQ